MQSDATQLAGTAEHSNGPLKTYTLLAKSSVDPVNQDFYAIEDAGFNNPLRQGRNLPSAEWELTSERLQDLSKDLLPSLTTTPSSMSSSGTEFNN